jgi:hypothetical protein
MTSLGCGLPDLAPRCRLACIILILLDKFMFGRQGIPVRFRAPMLL